MTKPPYLQKCRNCKENFCPSVEVESLPVFNSVDKSRWMETKCPNCGVNYRVARLSKKSLDVLLILAEDRPAKESKLIEAVLA
jgi:hypothetical protein